MQNSSEDRLRAENGNVTGHGNNQKKSNLKLSRTVSAGYWGHQAWEVQERLRRGAHEAGQKGFLGEAVRGVHSGAIRLGYESGLHLFHVVFSWANYSTSNGDNNNICNLKFLENYEQLVSRVPGIQSQPINISSSYYSSNYSYIYYIIKHKCSNLGPLKIQLIFIYSLLWSMYANDIITRTYKFIASKHSVRTQCLQVCQKMNEILSSP